MIFCGDVLDSLGMSCVPWECPVFLGYYAAVSGAAVDSNC